MGTSNNLMLGVPIYFITLYKFTYFRSVDISAPHIKTI